MSSNPIVNEPDPPPTEQAAARIDAGVSSRLPILMVGLISGWCLLLSRFGSGSNIYIVMGPFALTVLLVVAALSGNALRRWLRPTPLAVLSGLGVGAGMTLVTYPLYGVMRSIVPELDTEVAVLYSAAHQTSLAQALPWTLAIIVAEELLWRGALLEVLAGRVSPPIALAISVATYAAAQFGSRSWVVFVLALVCGSLWTAQRHLTRSLLSPLIAHLIWTPIVILLYPVTSI
jgi:membrane protease YdiL (CAAX protease family)